MIREIADAMITKGIAYARTGPDARRGRAAARPREGLAASAGLTATVLRAQINLTAQLPTIDPRGGRQSGRGGLRDGSTASAIGHGLAILVGNGAEAALPTGDYAWATRAVDEVLALDLDETDRGALGGIAIGLRVDARPSIRG